VKTNLTVTQKLALAFVASPFSCWADFAHANKIGVHGSTPEAQAVRMPPPASYARLAELGLIRSVGGSWVARVV
jgi:hypothetical protein